MKATTMAVMAILVMSTIAFSAYGASDEIDGKRFEAYLEKDYYLTNEVLKAYYAAYNTTTGELLSGAGHWEIWETLWWGPWDTMVAEGNFTSPSGVLQISLSTYNMTAGRYVLYMTYNVSGDVLEVSLYFDVDDIWVNVNVYSMEDGYYPNSYVMLDIYSNAIGANVGPITVYVEDAPDQWRDIAMYSSGDLNLVISSNGHAKWYYRLPNYDPGTRIMFRVEVKGYQTEEIITMEEKVQYILYLSTDKDSYAPGDTLNVEVKAEGTYPSGNLIYHWRIRWGGDTIYYTVSSSNTLSYKIPTWVSSWWLTILVDIYDGDNLIKDDLQTSVWVGVDYGDLYVIPEKDTFTGPGDRITLWFILDSEYIHNPMYLVTVEAYRDYTSIWSTTYETSDSTYTLTVPQVNATSLWVSVLAVEGGKTISDSVYLSKSVGTLNVIPEKNYFMRSGETINVDVILDTNGLMTNPTYNYTVTYYLNGAPVRKESVETTATTYTIVVPTEEPYKWADRIAVNVVAEEGDYKVSGSTVIYRMTTPRFSARLLTESDMINDVFVPGQTITIMYELELPETRDLDDVYLLYYSFDGDSDTEHMKVINVNEATTGTVQITIPEDTVTGGHYVYFELYSADGRYISSDMVVLSVDSTPQWSQGVIAGMSADMFLLTVLVAVILVLIAFNTFRPYLTGRASTRPAKERAPKIPRGKKMAPQEFEKPEEQPPTPPPSGGEELMEDEL